MINQKLNAAVDLVKACEMDFKTFFIFLVSFCLCGCASVSQADTSRKPMVRHQRVITEHNPDVIQQRSERNTRQIVQRAVANTELQLLSQMASQKADAEQRLTWFKYAFGLGIALTTLIGFLIYTLLIRRRLTEVRQQLESENQQRQLLEKRVNHLQRIESLGMLAGGVAHDFNNLLVGVLCNAELLGTTPNAQDEFTKDRLEQIIHSAEKAADLSRQMLAYAGKVQISKTPTELNTLISRMESVLMSTLGKQMHLELDLSPDQIVANVDPTQIEQILLNLVSNARQASDDRGEVIIRTGVEQIHSVTDDETLFGTRETGGHFIFFEVEDSGVGIAPDQIRRIFDPFFTSREDGRGLGLAVVYGVVKGHSGLIRAQTVPNEGTCFRILLPVSSARASLTLGHNNETNDQLVSSLSGLNILVVDDEPSVRETAKALLEVVGCNVRLANDGADAFRVMDETTPFSIDCILLDVVMPRMGAKEVLEEMRERNQKTPIILMSGHSETQLDHYRKSKEVASILSKPFKTRELLEAISDAVEKRQAGSKR